jgi:hypothetical protein
LVDTTPRGRGGFAGILDAGSAMLALPSNSELIAFEPSDVEYKQLTRNKLADTPTYAHPAIAGDTIFVKGQETVAMWTFE